MSLKIKHPCFVDQGSKLTLSESNVLSKSYLSLLDSLLTMHLLDFVMKIFVVFSDLIYDGLEDVKYLFQPSL